MTLRVPTLPFAARSQVEKALLALDRAVGPSKLLLDETARAPYARDDSPAQGRLPDVVVLAESREDVIAVLRIAEAHDVPVTPRAAGTGRTGGAVPVAGGIVLSMSAMDKIVELDRREMLVVVQPGLKTGARSTPSPRPRGSSTRPIPARRPTVRWAATRRRTPAAPAPSSTASPATTSSAPRPPSSAGARCAPAGAR